MKKFIPILLLFAASLIALNTVSASNLAEEKEVKIFQISFEQSVDHNFDDLLLRKSEGFIKYQWEPEGLYIIMETNVTEGQLYEVLKQLNLSSTFKISGFKNRVLPVKALKN